MGRAKRRRQESERLQTAGRARRSRLALATLALLVAGVGIAAAAASTDGNGAIATVDPPAATSPAPPTPRTAVLPAGVMHSSETEGNDAPVEVFIGGDRLWKPSTLNEALKGEREFDLEGQLVDPRKVRNEYHGLLGGIEGVTRDKVDICLEPPTRGPEQDDVVQVLDMGVEPPLGTHERFATVGSLQGGTKIRFQYEVYDVVRTGAGQFELRWVDSQWGRVRRTWKSTTDTIVDLTYRTADGKEITLSGTVEHPFFVPAVDDFVAMSRLTTGTVLETDDGTVATVTSSSVRHGEFEVYGFDVEGHNTYFVGGSSDNPGVLVHNRSWMRPSGWRLPSKRYGTWANAKKVGDSDFVLNRRTARSLSLPEGTRTSSHSHISRRTSGSQA
jgi:hypothetical protein